MLTKRFISAALLVMFGLALFTACTQDSVAEDTELYDPSSVDKNMRPMNKAG